MAATPKTCATALSATLGTNDPTALQDRAVAPVTVRRGAATNVRVWITRDGRTVGSGTAAKLGRGTAAVPRRLRTAPVTGAVRVRVSGRVAGCGAVSGKRVLRLRSASLPVRAAHGTCRPTGGCSGGGAPGG